MNWKFAPLFILTLAVFSGCNGGSSSSSGGGNPPPVISVAFTSGTNAPPTTMNTGATTSLTANVSNDSSSAGVTWSCAPAGTCGTFNPTTTASGSATSYTAPSAVPSGGSVSITATSKADGSKTAVATITITAAVTISVSISTAPPATLATSGTATVVATTNDTAGVTWSCTPANSCGSFNPTTTLTGITATYTPTGVTGGTTVTITATSVTDHTKSASANVVITGIGSATSLKGLYTFLLTAPTGVRGTTTWVGSVNLDGAGNVIAISGSTGSPTSQCPSLPIAGMEDLISFYQPGAMPPANYFDQADPIVPSGVTIPVTNTPSLSTYSVGPTGIGRLTLSTCNGETLGISFVVTSAKHAEVIEADGAGGAGGDPASGSMDLQTTTSLSQISGSYSFAVSGIDAASTTKLAFGGVFATDGSGVITSGSIDVTSTGSPVASYTLTSGSMFDAPPPDANGRGTFHFSVSAANQSRTFVYYIVGPKVLRLMESDNIADVGGSAYLQGAASATLSGPYVYQHSGWTSTARAVAAGQFTPASGSISGISDANTGAAPSTTPATSVAVTGSYSASATETATVNFPNFVDASGTSTFNAYLVDPTINILDPNNTTSGGGGALLLHTDANINGTGILVPQTATQVLAGNYALNLTNSIAASTPNELDLVGVLTADGVSSFGTTNLADYDQNDANTSNPMIGATLAGGFTPDAAHAGRNSGTFTVTQPATSATGTPYPFIPGAAFTVSIYQANAAQGFVVETDNQSNIIGHIVQQILP